MFNPVDEATFHEVTDAWAGAVLRLAMLLPGHPAVQRDLPDLCAGCVNHLMQTMHQVYVLVLLTILLRFVHVLLLFSFMFFEPF